MDERSLPESGFHVWRLEELGALATPLSAGKDFWLDDMRTRHKVKLKCTGLNPNWEVVDTMYLDSYLRSGDPPLTKFG